MNSLATPKRTQTLGRFAVYAIFALFFKILIAIIVEYRFYFPANFDAAFLIGREKTFSGLYRASFYLHIVTGPACIILAAFLVTTGPRLATNRRRIVHRAHRVAGRIQAVLVLLFLVPTGLVMARHAFAGPIAAAGFTVLSLATAGTMCATIVTALRRNIDAHRRWAIRCFILLTSPLFLRFVSGLLQTTDLESDLTYRLNAWLSWLAPLFAYECWRLFASTTHPTRHPSHTSSSALQEFAK